MVLSAHRLGERSSSIPGTGRQKEKKAKSESARDTSVVQRRRRRLQGLPIVRSDPRAGFVGEKVATATAAERQQQLTDNSSRAKMQQLFKVAAVVGAFALSRTPAAVSGFGLTPRAPSLSSADRAVPAWTEPRGGLGHSRVSAAVCHDINMIATAPAGGTPRAQAPRGGRGAAAKKVCTEGVLVF